MAIKAILLALALFAGSSSNGQEYSGPQCVGPFCLARHVSIRTLFRQLGPPARRPSPYDSYCYGTKDGKAFLYIDKIHSEPDQVGDVLLADFPNCMHSPVQTTSEDLRAWKTHEGIGLDSSETDVLKAYGDRGLKEKIVPGNDNVMKFFVSGYRHGDKWVNIGEETISYRGTVDDLRTAIFCIKDGKVSCIFLSQNE